MILTRSGSDASAYLKDGAEVSVPVDRVDVVDTIGAGDTFNAGVLARLAELGMLVKGLDRRHRSGADAGRPQLRHAGRRDHRVPRRREPAVAA